jgi:hypothetical protein
MPWPRYAPNGGAEYCPAAEDDPYPRTGALYALQGLLAGSGLPYKRSHLVALRPTKISASEPRSTWWPGER